jgi:hypothetical protein
MSSFFFQTNLPNPSKPFCRFHFELLFLNELQMMKDEQETENGIEP